jgi:putative hydrolase of the HAD superfamily
VTEARAVVFDLDDTLYPLEHFVRSGLAAVASAVAAAGPIDRAGALAILRHAQATQRGRELQALVGHLLLHEDWVPALVDVIRSHVPDIRLPELSLAVLRALRPAWRLGIVTNGRPDIQARKVRALNLRRLVDAVVYADEHAAGGKPNPAPFLEVCRRLDVRPDATIFVGDDPDTDVAGAHAAGMRTVWVPRLGSRRSAPAPADAVLASLADVPAAADRLVAPDWRAHVA